MSYLLTTKHEISQDQRRHQRVNYPAKVIIDSGEYEVVNWSLGGCQIAGFVQSLKPGDCLPIQLVLYSQEDLKFSVKVLIEIIWISTYEKQTGVRFLGLSQLEEEVLNNFIKHLDEIQKNHIPLASYQSSNSCLALEPEKLLAQIERRRNPKKILSSLAFVIVGGILGFYTLSSLQKSLAFLEIKSAVISHPIEPIAATDSGTLQHIFVGEGMKVKAGQELFQISNEQKINEEIIRLENLIYNQTHKLDGLNEKLTLASLELAETQLESQRLLNFQNEENSTLKTQMSMAQSQLDSAEAKLEALNTQYQLAVNNSQHLVRLMEQGAMSEKVVNEQDAKVASLKGQMEAAHSELTIAKTIFLEVQQGKIYDGSRPITNINHLAINQENARQKVTLATQKVNYFQQFRQQAMQKLQELKQQQFTLKKPELNQKYYANHQFLTSYKAPVSGSLLKVFKSKGNKVNRNENVILLQHELDRPIIDAYLTHAQADLVAIGSKATVNFLNLDQSYQAQVVKIDRTGGLTDLIKGQYQLQGSPEQSVHVELKILNLTPQDEHQLAAGIPVTLLIPKTNRIFSKVK
jgi:multidrug resistance efflux pump